MSRKRTKEIAAEVGGVATRAAITGAAHAASLAVGPTAVLAGTAGLIAKRAIGKAYESRLNARIERWLSDLAAALEFGTAERVEQVFEENATAKWATDGLIESFRHLLGALDDETIPYIARLTALYVAEKKPPDELFRSLGGFLSEVSGRELTAFRSLVGQLSTINAPPVTRWLELALGKDVVNVRIYEKNKEIVLAEILSHGCERRIFALAKRHTLGYDSASGYLGSVSGPHILHVSVDMPRQLAKIFQ